jgi:hypothetical protein
MTLKTDSIPIIAKRPRWRQPNPNQRHQTETRAWHGRRPGSIPRCPLPAVLDLIQAAALLGGGGQPPTGSYTTTSGRPPVLLLGRLIKICTQPLLELLAGTAHDVA